MNTRARRNNLLAASLGALVFADPPLGGVVVVWFCLVFLFLYQNAS